MNEDLKSLFEAMRVAGFVPENRTFEEFQNAHVSPEKQAALYGFLKSQNFELPDEQAFKSKFFTGIEPVKKKDDGGTVSSAPSSPSAAPAPIAVPPSINEGLVTETVARESTAAPQAIQRDISPQLDPDKQYSTPELAAKMKGQMGYQPDMNITGDEDPVKEGEKIRAGKDVAYDYRKKYDETTQYRKEKRDLGNIVAFGERARMQAGVANDVMMQRYGETWLEDLQAMSKQLEAVDPNNATPEQIALANKYNAVIADEFFQKWQNAQKAGDKSFKEYKAKAKSGEYGKIESIREASRKMREQDDSLIGRTMDGAVRTGAQLLGSLVSLPRTVERGLGLLPDNFTGADELGAAGDAIKEWAGVYAPKASKYEQRVFEKRTDFEGKIVAVDGNGNPESVRNKNGNIVEVDQDFINRFKESGKAAQAKSEFTGAGNVLDKVAGITTDLLIMRALGGGTKAGTALSSFGMMHQQAYNEAIQDLNMDPNDAAQYAMLTSAAQGAIEAYVGNIETMIGKTGKIAGAMTSAQLKPLVGKLTAGELAVARLSPILKQVGDENAEEILQQITDNELKGRFNAETGAKMDNRFELNDFKEIVLLTTLATGLASGPSALSAIDDTKRRAALALAESPDKWEYALKQLQTEGAISPEKAQVINQRAQKIRQYAGNLPTGITEDQKSAALAKEWARMELEERAKDETTLPAQRDVAKQAANSLKSEIQTDIQPETSLKSEDEPVQEPVAPEDQPSAGMIGNLRIAQEEEVQAEAQPPIEVPRALPNDFRMSEETSTAAAEMYANQRPATELADQITASEATGDEVGDMAYQVLRQKGYEPSEAEGGQVRRFFADSMGVQEGTVDEAFNSLADEYIQTYAPKAPAKNRMSIESIEDQAADFFENGGKINPASFDRHGDRNYRDDKSVSSLYFKRGAAEIDQLAHSWADKFGLSESEAVQRIVDFMVKHGKKNFGEYMTRRVAEQEQEKDSQRDDEIFDSATEGMDITPEEVDPLRSEATTQVDEAMSQVDQTTMRAMEEWLGQFTDEKGMVSPSKVREGIQRAEQTPMDDGFNQSASEKWDNIPEQGKNIIRKLSEGKPVEITESVEEPMQEEGISESGMTFEEFTAEYSSDPEVIREQWNNGGEFRWAAELSDQAYQQVENIVNGKDQGTITKSGVQQQSPGAAINPEAGQTPGENQGTQSPSVAPNQNEPGRPYRSDISEIGEVASSEATANSKEDLVAAREQVVEALKEIQLPSKVTLPLAAEMVDQGLITVEEYDIIATAINSGEEIPEQVRIKAEGQIEGLREVPEWLSAFNAAVAQRARDVLNGTAQPGQPIITEHNGEVIMGNVTPLQAEALRRNGAEMRGRAWVFPASNKDSVFAAAFQPETPAIQNTAGSFGGMVSRLFGRRNGHRGMKGMTDAVSNADGTDAKIDAAARHLPAAKAMQIAETLSKKFGVPVVTNRDEINAALIESGHQELVNDPAVRGFEYNGKIYMNLEQADAEVPIHEFGHLWEAAARGTDAHSQGMEAIRGSAYETAVRSNPNYAGLSEEEILQEALAMAIGQRGAMITNDNNWAKFQDFLKTLWMRMQTIMGIDVQNMRAQEFADYVATILLEDQPPTISLSQSDPKAQFLFAGEKADQMRSDVRENLTTAKQMEQQGMDANEIWLATGWFRGVEGQWKYMIADRPAMVKISAQALFEEAQDPEGRKEYTLDEILYHPELFATFPELKTIPVTTHKGEGTMVQVMDGKYKMQIDPEYPVLTSPTPDGMMTGMILHETQHIIQRVSGFAQGGNVNAALFIAEEALDLAPDDPKVAALKKQSPRDIYRRISGEVEARLVQDLRTDNVEDLDEVPTAQMDVAPEDQILVFDNVTDAAEMLAGVKPKPSFLFGRKQVANVAAIQSARQIIEAEIAAGKDPAATGTLDKLAKLGINRATAERLYAEVQAKNKGARILSTMGKRAFSEQTWEKVKKVFFEYFRVRGLMPRALFDQSKASEAKIKGHVYGMQQAINRLGKAVDKTLDKKTDQNRNLVWQQIQNVLEGSQDINTIDPSLHDGINEVRARMDELTTALVMSGAVGPSMAITMLGNAGIDIQAANPNMVSLIGKALSKYPSERTPMENQAIENFLQQYGGALGSYLYRSYQANDDNNWRYMVTQDVENRAKRKLAEMIRSEMADEIHKLDDKHADLDAKIDEKKDEIQDKLDAVRKQADDAQQKLNDIIQKQAAYQAQNAKANKNLLRQEQAAAKRLKALRDMLRNGTAVANLSPLDFALMIQAPGFDPTVLNTLMKAIYSRRNQIIELENRKAKAQTASYARLQQLDHRLNNLDHEIDTMLERDKSGSIMAAGKLGSVSSQITQGKRKDIPVEFRDLLGEYRDPRVNMMRSVLRVATAMEHQKFLNEIKEVGLKDGWLSTKEAKTGPLTVELASPNSDTMDPLNGLWTTPEIAKVFNEHNHSQELGWMARIYYSTVGAVKVGKTILSTGAQGRNLMSNFFQAIYNGWIGYPMGGQKFEAFIAAWAAFKETQSPEMAQEFEAMVRAGVLGNSTTAGEIREAAKLITSAARGETFMDTPVTQPPKGVKKAYEKLVQLYQASDEFLRIWGFRVERERYAQALYGNTYEALTPRQQQEVFDRAAGVIRQITPDYGMIPKIGELLRLNPLTGTFVSWQMEVFRNYVNRFTLAREEYRDPRLRHIGLSRMAYLAIGHGVWAGLAAATAAMAGIGDDEEKAIDQWLKPWQKGTTKLWIGKDTEKGQWTFFNLGYIDPYAFWQQPYALITAPTEQPLMDKSLEAAYKMMGPILQPDLVAITAAQVFMNINVQTGKRIAVPEYGANTENIHRMYSFIRKRLQPGLLKTATEMIDAGNIGVIDNSGNVKTIPSISADAVGLNFETVQPKMAFEQYILDQRYHKEAILEALDKVRRVELSNLNRAQKADISKEQLARRTESATERINEIYELTDEVYNKHLRDLGVQMQNANKYLGISMGEIRKVLDSQHYSTDEISVILGFRPNIKPKIKKIKF